MTQGIPDVEPLIFEQGTVKDLAAIGAWVERCCDGCGLDARTAYHIKLAVDEGCANVFEHGYRGRPGRIELECQRDALWLTIRIRDWGVVFDPESVDLPDTQVPLESRRIGGLGIYLMHQVMDRVTYDFDVEHGNTLTLAKRRPA